MRVCDLPHWLVAVAFALQIFIREWQMNLKEKLVAWVVAFALFLMCVAFAVGLS